jgi:hypothetical protein
VILTACVLAMSLIGAASASASSTGFHIYNLTSGPLKLTAIKWEGVPEKSATAPEPPKVGDILPPGAPPLHIEIEYREQGIFQPVLLSSVRLTFKSVRDGERGPIQMTLYDGNPASPGYRSGPSVECPDGPGWRCVPNSKNDPDEVRLLEPPESNREVGAGNPDRQAELMRTLCTRAAVDAGAVRCGFAPVAKEMYGPLHDVGEPFVNCSSQEGYATIKYSEKVGVTNSVGLKREPDTETIFQRAEAGADDRDQAKWLNEHTFTGSEEIGIPGGWIGWLQNTYPIVRHVGDFGLRIGNTLWALHDVYFDTPDPGRPTGHDLDDHQMTPAEREKRCG